MFTACGFETVRSGYREGRTVNHRKQVSSRTAQQPCPVAPGSATGSWQGHEREFSARLTCARARAGIARAALRHRHFSQSAACVRCGRWLIGPDITGVRECAHLTMSLRPSPVAHDCHAV